MFLRMYRYKLKSMFRQKEELFWIIFFPMILGTFFYLAFAKVASSTEEFKTVDIAVVEDESEAGINSMFNSMIESLYGDTEGRIHFFNISYVDSGKAADLLSSKSVTAVITLKEGLPVLTINKNGIYETMVKSVIDSYIQISAVISSANGDAEKTAEVIKIMGEQTDSIVEKNLTKGNTDNLTNYFYALIAMACMFATLSGLSCATGLNANLSAIGMRKSLAPQNKTGMILSDACAAFTLHLFSNALLIIYLKYVLRINLGGDFIHIYLVTVFGSLIAMCIGILIGSNHKLSEEAKVGISISISLVSSFMSDLMVSGIKRSIEKTVPIINRINPSTLVSDALYALNIYDDYGVYSNRLIIMASISVVFIAISFIITRREKYDSI